MQKAKEKAAAPSEAERDGPLLDLSDSAVKRMIKTAKARGYVTYDEPLSVDHILNRMEEVANVLPDPLVIVFYHPFMHNAEGREDDLERLVDGVARLNYRFVSACAELAAAR